MKQPAGTDSDLVARVRALLAGPDLSERKMFGGVCFMLNGHMVAGTLRGELLVRVGKEGNDAALARPHTHQMEMGRPAPGYVMIAAEGTRADRDLKEWLDIARAHVAMLPAKKKKAKKKRAKPAGR